jgi:hypothetical protein
MGVIKKTFIFRLLLDAVAAGLLLLALAYYWLDNAVHEWVGTSMFLLLLAHTIFNRRWYANIPKRRATPQNRVDLVLTLSLLLAMLGLLVTSVLVSHTVFGALPWHGGPGVRRIHALLAYWAVVLVALHLGLRWHRVMFAAHSLFKLVGTSRVRTGILRVLALAVVVCGLQSSFAMGLGSKLTLQMNLDWWNFEDSVAGFFLHWLSIVGLYAALGHYAAALRAR